ncbi:MAG: hypothetical protein M3300_01305 [Actinomycetota bacterium]|nr:hypothetical protein [Actinomycetota bacterium]
MPHDQAVVVAIAGPSGAGKTTLVQHVAALLADATPVYFDDYAALSTYPEDLAAWLAAGADPDRWQTPRLAADVQALRSGMPVLHPDGTIILQPARYVVLEEPFGRERQEMALAIDVVVVIDLPLEIALARRLRRTMSHGREQWSTEQLLTHMEDYLAAYLAWGRTLYRVVNRRAMQSCDIVVDGTQPPEVLARQIVEAVRSRSP